jgi:hypothetical protein
VREIKARSPPPAQHQFKKLEEEENYERVAGMPRWDIWELLGNFLKTGLHACIVQVDLKNYFATFTSDNICFRFPSPAASLVLI